MTSGSFRFTGFLYPIIDVGTSARRAPLELAAAVLAGGATVVQLRAKKASTRDLCELARALQELCEHHRAQLIINDRTDIARLVRAAGVHLGQTDLPPRDARAILGAEAIIGFSTHTLDQVRDADALGCIDYLGFGPIFRTASKENADPCQGLDGLREARAATRMPIAAIGGITAACALDVRGAGADAAAMINALATSDDPASVIRRLQSNGAIGTKPITDRPITDRSRRS